MFELHIYRISLSILSLIDPAVPKYLIILTILLLGYPDLKKSSVYSIDDMTRSLKLPTLPHHLFLGNKYINKCLAHDLCKDVLDPPPFEIQDAATRKKLCVHSTGKTIKFYS